MRNRNRLEFIGLWEVLNNPDFNRVQFDTLRNEAGLNRFTMTPQKWIDSTNAIGIISKSGRGGGTFAYPDIAKWCEENPDLKGNMRDYASLNELLVLANMESYNAILIGKGMDQKERMIELRKLARTQLMSLEKLGDSGIKKL